MITVEEFKKLPSGRVLLRDGKKRFRILKPIKKIPCNTCKTTDYIVVGRWERGAGESLGTLCPLCSIIMLNKREK